jgi:hypothetical protein
MSNEKYILTENTMQYQYGMTEDENGNPIPLFITLYQIQSLITINLIDGTVINPGDLGGWVDSDGRLSATDICWAADNSIVFSLGDPYPLLYGQAVSRDNVVIRDIANVYGCAILKDNVIVQDAGSVAGQWNRPENTITVSGNVQVTEQARVLASIDGDTIFDNHDIYQG